MKDSIIKVFNLFNTNIYDLASVEETVLEEDIRFIEEVNITAKSPQDLGKIIAVLNIAYGTEWDWFEQFDIIIRSKYNKVIFQKRYLY